MTWGKWSPKAGCGQQPAIQIFQSYNHKQLNFTNKVTELQSGFFSKASRQQPTFLFQPCETLAENPAEPNRTREPWNDRGCYLSHKVYSNLLHRNETTSIIDPMSFCPCWIKRLGILGLGLFQGLLSQKRKGSAMETSPNLKVRSLGSCPCDAVYKMLVTLKKTHSAPLFPSLWNDGRAPSVLTALGGWASQAPDPTSKRQALLWTIPHARLPSQISLEEGYLLPRWNLKTTELDDDKGLFQLSCSWK